MHVKTGPHMDADQIERYSLAVLPAEELEEVEEHLLLCDSCRRRVQEVDGYVATMAAAAREVRHEERSVRSRFLRFLLPAAAVLALLAGASVLTNRSGERVPAGAPFAITLEATRGAPEHAVPVGRPLTLEFDLATLPAAATYRIEVVDQSGSKLWSGTATSAGAQATSHARALDRGYYFVRLSLMSGELLREYGLTVR